MNTLRKHLSFIIPLIGLLFSLQCIMLLQRIVANQEDFITQNYSIGITSKTKLTLDQIKGYIKDARALNAVDSNAILKELTQDIKDKDLINIKQLPFFYTLNLSNFPDSDRLNAIQAVLKQIPNIISVNTFAKRHLENFSLLYFIKISTLTFSLLLLATSFILIIKQIEIWKYAHKEMMEVMDIHGASVWIKNGSLFKMAIIDSFIAAIIISAFIFYLSNNSIILQSLQYMQIKDDIFEIGFDFVRLFIFGFIVSLISVIFVVISKGRA